MFSEANSYTGEPNLRILRTAARAPRQEVVTVAYRLFYAHASYGALTNGRLVAATIDAQHAWIKAFRKSPL